MLLIVISDVVNRVRNGESIPYRPALPATTELGKPLVDLIKSYWSIWSGPVGTRRPNSVRHLDTSEALCAKSPAESKCSDSWLARGKLFCRKRSVERGVMSILLRKFWGKLLPHAKFCSRIFEICTLFHVTSIATLLCFPTQNFTEIRQSAAVLWPIHEYGGRPPSWI